MYEKVTFALMFAGAAAGLGAASEDSAGVAQPTRLPHGRRGRGSGRPPRRDENAPHDGPAPSTVTETGRGGDPDGTDHPGPGGHHRSRARAPTHAGPLRPRHQAGSSDTATGSETNVRPDSTPRYYILAENRCLY